MSHTRSSSLPPEEEFEDDKLEEKKTRAYSKIIGYVKKLDLKQKKLYGIERL